MSPLKLILATTKRLCPDTKIPFVYVAIQRTGPTQLHAGMFYFHTDDQRLEVLHHPWHKVPLDRDPNWQAYSWVENDWDQDIARNIRARCRAVFEANTSLNYSLVYDANTHFDENGVLVQTNAAQGRPGLTCSTFVLAILNGVGVDILDEDQWPSQSADQKWATKMLNHHLKPKDPSYAQAMKTNMAKWARFSPEDVAAASGLPQPPVPDRATVTPHGKDIASKV